ncbi:MAG TPA: hypothetical protein VK730_12105 [Solirubrobacteraceae bacterium]|nr:hypothetical protein [Solirubrobacteraceae bacterium]
MGISIAPARAIGAQAKPFAITAFSMRTTRATPVPYGPGLPGYGFVNEPYSFTQAGGHPDSLTSMIEFASEEVNEGRSIPTHNLKDLVIDLPPGLVANPLAVARCPRTHAIDDGICPVDSQVGVFVLHFAGDKTILGPIVDLTPEAGQTAELGLVTPLKITVPLPGHIVRTSAGYAFALVANGLPTLEITGMETTLWGVPAEAVHDPLRGLNCTAESVQQQWTCEGGGTKSDEASVPFLTMPSDCAGGPLSGTVWADSWEEAGRYVQAKSTFPTTTDCSRLPFAPEIEVRPDTLLADAPVGLTVNVATPQSESAQEVAAPQLRTTRMTLAQGLSISPGVADGLQACGHGGTQGIDIPTGLNAESEPLAPDEVGEGEEPGPGGEARLAPGHCPQASIVGSAEAVTPLLASPIKGRVYLAAPDCGGPDQAPCTEADAVDGNLYRMYVELGGKPGGEGLDIKVEAKVQANLATGQLTLTLIESPQLPISRLSINLTGGPRALLDNPATCGPSRTTSDLQAWSAPGTTPAPENLLVPGTPDADPSSFYEVTGCFDGPFHPGFLAGTVTPRAGMFSAFTFEVTRSDREPYLSQIQVQAPTGLSAMLSSVPPCGEALANAGRCPEASFIGSTLISSGAGSLPFELPGRIYLTTGYHGAPFGLSIVTDAIAGPLDLGLMVIRARVDVNPQTAAIEITSDPLPQIVLGVPLRVQKVALDIDRPGFMFNPTNCNPLVVAAAVTATQDASAEVSNQFAVADCRSLAFKPKLGASTSGRTSYTSGASLDVKLAFPDTKQGTEANLAQLKVALPKQLPSRLTTLQSACPETIFGANPAACPKASVVGIARARTPALAGVLTGPVYFVSHGRDAFPSPVVVLQGDGVSIVLRGSTTVEKSGLARIDFDALPDMPINSLELYLPQGPHSVLSANTDLCALTRTLMVRRSALERVGGRAVRRVIDVRKRVRANLLMPTELVAQNGAVIHQSTKIEVGGCTASKTKTANKAPPSKT